MTKAEKEAVMAKRKADPVKPVYPTLHEYEGAIHNALQEAGMLLTSVEIALQYPNSFAKLAPDIRERADKLREAFYGPDKVDR